MNNENPMPTLPELLPIIAEMRALGAEGYTRYATFEELRNWADRLEVLATRQGEAVAFGHWAEGLPVGTRLMEHDGEPLVRVKADEFWNVPLFAAPVASEWISVKDRLPEERTRVNGWNGLSVEDCYYGIGRICRQNAEPGDAIVCWRTTHDELQMRWPPTLWMPLPQPPAMQGKEHG